MIKASFIKNLEIKSLKNFRKINQQMNFFLVKNSIIDFLKTKKM